MDLELGGKTAIVTGGSIGIGKAITEMLAAEGCRVAVCDIEPRETAEAFADAVTASTGTKCIAIHTDVTKEDDVKRMSDEVIRVFGSYDILVNNAAAITTAQAGDMDLATWQMVVDVNMTGTFLAAKEAVNHFREKGVKGRIINMTSQSAFLGTTSGHVHYSASKAGVVGFTRSLAKENAPYGINVNAVAPGVARTPIMAQKIKDRPGHYEQKVPLGYIAEPEEVAYAVIFLASVMGTYVTGSTLDVSGGMMMR